MAEPRGYRPNTNDVHCKKQGSEKATRRGEFECGLEIQMGFFGLISNARSKKEKKMQDHSRKRKYVVGTYCICL